MLLSLFGCFLVLNYFTLHLMLTLCYFITSCFNIALIRNRDRVSITSVSIRLWMKAFEQLSLKLYFIFCLSFLLYQFNTTSQLFSSINAFNLSFLFNGFPFVFVNMVMNLMCRTKFDKVKLQHFTYKER